MGSGVLGELDTRVLLEQWGSNHSDAVRVASGWSGDQWQLIEKDGRTAMVVKSTWATPEAAREFFSAYSGGLRYRFDSATTEESSQNRQALTTPVTATDLRIQGSDVLAVIKDKPISFEVFADEFPEMKRQALEIKTWGDNVYVKIPITNTKRESAAPLIRELTNAGVKLNVTA